MLDEVTRERAAGWQAGLARVGGKPHGVSGSDPWTYATVVALIMTVGLLASWLPARRATAIDPASALRSD